MKKFTRVEPSTVQEIGERFKDQIVIKRFETDDGLLHEFTTIYKEGSRAAGVIALTPDNQVITLFQFRPGPEKWVHDIPGGGVYPDEDVLAGALRELQEETGYVPGEIEFLGTSYGNNYQNLNQYYYFATNCTLSGGALSLDAEEYEQGVEVRLLTIAEFIEQAKLGVVSDSAAVLMAYEKLKYLEDAK